jgi:hypothetical protein
VQVVEGELGLVGQQGVGNVGVGLDVPQRLPCPGGGLVDDAAAAGDRAQVDDGGGGGHAESPLF